MLEKGGMYAEVDTRKKGSTNAEMGLMCDEGDAKALVEAQHSCVTFLQGDFIDREGRSSLRRMDQQMPRWG